MAYSYRTGVRVEKQNHWLSGVVVAVLLLLLIFITYVAWHNAQPLTCDAITYDTATNARVCTLMIE